MLNVHVAALYDFDMIIGVRETVEVRRSADWPKPGPTTALLKERGEPEIMLRKFCNR